MHGYVDVHAKTSVGLGLSKIEKQLCTNPR